MSLTEWIVLAVFGGWAVWLALGDIERDRIIREANEDEEPAQ